ncbi:vitamin K epoxide reductase family protein [Pedobacter cryoconitis]|uniref:vitamin K epoxide reductase family protein n=1 Tax=Pedobacter cryoconitis TaxID=188932 RepID=UPI0016225601|nr:vitamin K epoxide reductase family protein [Pedobacter cryoconitis]
MIEFLLNELIRLNSYIIDEKRFNEYFSSHPDYPSLAAIENTFAAFNIENIISKFENEYFEDLPEVFISSIENHFSDLVLIIKKDLGVLVIDKQNESFMLGVDEFLKQWTGIVVAIEKKEEAAHIDTSSHKNKFKQSFKFTSFGIIGITLGYSFWKFSTSEITYIVISLVGLYYCVEIYKNQHGEKSIIVEKICNDEKKESSCQKIMQSDKLNIFGLKLSDIALFYFITTAILGLFIHDTQFLIIILSILNFPVVSYSLYVQLIKEKKLCKICLILVILLLIQAGISLFYFNYSFSIEVLILSVIYLSSILLVYIYINKTIDENNKLKSENTINLRFKRNYDIFKRELLLSQKVEFEHQNLFFLGNKDAKVHITLISNLECKFCEEAHHLLKKLYLENESDISFQIRFNFSDDKMSTKIDSIFKTLLYSYSLNEKQFLEALDFCYKEKNYNAFINKFGLYNNQNIDMIQKIKNENLSKELNFTPAFLLNGFIFPQKYEKEDILYFVKDLVNDEEI